jgi:single-strand DNA-binding protein
MLNKAQIIGRVGKDPEMRETKSGDPVASFSVATSERYRDKRNGGEIVEKTEWHSVTAFGRLAEIVGEYVRKGALVYVEGKLETRKYERDGIDRYSTSIIAGEIRLLSPKGERGVDGRSASAPPLETPSGQFDDDVPF